MANINDVNNLIWDLADPDILQRNDFCPWCNVDHVEGEGFEHLLHCAYSRASWFRKPESVQGLEIAPVGSAVKAKAWDELRANMLQAGYSELGGDDALRYRDDCRRLVFNMDGIHARYARHLEEEG